MPFEREDPPAERRTPAVETPTFGPALQLDLPSAVGLQATASGLVTVGKKERK
jgi:hypothetical protein